MRIWVLVYNQDVNFESPSYQTKSLAHKNTIQSGDKVLMSRNGEIVGEAFVNGDPNTWDNMVLSLAGVRRVNPYPTPIRCNFPINPMDAWATWQRALDDAIWEARRAGFDPPAFYPSRLEDL
jgi:hypothetical protein